MVPADPATQLRECSIALLPRALPLPLLTRLHDAARRCFESPAALPPQHRFNPFSHSVLLTALADFGCALEDLQAPLTPALHPLFAQALGGPWTCCLDHSWLRKKFAPCHAPDPRYQPHSWHQDGALGVRFPPEPGTPIPIAALVTCWFPLTPCGLDRPGLEFVRRPQPALLHFTELDDALLRRRFAPHEFWVPALEPGDALVFLNTTLHRTWAHPGMPHNRLSVEYRIFPTRA